MARGKRQPGGQRVEVRFENYRRVNLRPRVSNAGCDLTRITRLRQIDTDRIRDVSVQSVKSVAPSFQPARDLPRITLMRQIHTDRIRDVSVQSVKSVAPGFQPVRDLPRITRMQQIHTVRIRDVSVQSVKSVATSTSAG
jgi:hypothetical protein